MARQRWSARCCSHHPHQRRSRAIIIIACVWSTGVGRIRCVSSPTATRSPTVCGKTPHGPSARGAARSNNLPICGRANRAPRATAKSGGLLALLQQQRAEGTAVAILLAAGGALSEPIIASDDPLPFGDVRCGYRVVRSVSHEQTMSAVCLLQHVNGWYASFLLQQQQQQKQQTSIWPVHKSTRDTTDEGPNSITSLYPGSIYQRIRSLVRRLYVPQLALAKSSGPLAMIHSLNR
jgi:hypothetical protein